MIEYLTDQIEKFGIKDINEDVKDLFKSKTKEELEEATDVYIKKLALRIGIGWALVEYLYKAGYRYNRTDRLQNHWFKHKTLDSSSGGHYALNKYTAYQDIKKYVDKWTKGLNENLNKNNITILYPGAFKPITGAHIDIIKRYLNQSNVEKLFYL